MIELKDLSLARGASAPVSDVSCKLHNGGVIGVIGDKGAGKSALLALLAGASLPAKGEVKLGGFDTRTESARAKAQVGYLPDGYEPDGTLTPTEYLLLLADVYDVRYERAIRHAQELLELIGLSKKRERLIASLRTGEKRMLAIAGAIIHNPEFIILDAPLSGLELRDAQRVREWLAQLGNRHTVIVSARKATELEKICGRTLLMPSFALVDGIAEAPTGASTPTDSEAATVPQKPPKKSRWQLLTDGGGDFEYIDDKGDTRK